MWDPINGTLVPTGAGINSENINFVVPPFTRINNTMPSSPYGNLGIGTGTAGLGVGLPYDMYSFSNRSNNLPLKANEHNSSWGNMLGIGGILLAGVAGLSIFAGVKGFKALKRGTTTGNKSSFFAGLGNKFNGLLNTETRRLKYVSKQLSNKFKGLTPQDFKTLENNLKGADKQTFKRVKGKIKKMDLNDLNQWASSGFNIV